MTDTQPVVITVQPAEALTPEVAAELKKAWMLAMREVPFPSPPIVTNFTVIGGESAKDEIRETVRRELDALVRQAYAPRLVMDPVPVAPPCPPSLWMQFCGWLRRGTRRNAD